MKRKKATPETAKLLSAVLTTATAMSLRLTDDDGGGGDDEDGERGGAVAGDGDGGAIAGGGVAKAGVRVDGNCVWMFRCGCAAARGARRRMRRRRGRSGRWRGAIGGVMRWGGRWDGMEI